MYPEEKVIVEISVQRTGFQGEVCPLLDGIGPQRFRDLLWMGYASARWKVGFAIGRADPPGPKHAAEDKVNGRARREA